MNRSIGRIGMTLLLVLVWLPLAGGCANKRIKGTQIEDNSKTREIIRVVESYRRSVENRDIDMLTALASPNYFEKNGDNNSRNNYDYNGLLEFLQSEYFRRISSIKLTIVYRTIEFSEDENVVKVRYNFTLNFKMPPPRFEEKMVTEGAEPRMEDNFDKEIWYAKNDSNQMVLEKMDEKWYIIKGM